ncbi:unnamed protein product [Brachionus calyciflorus]|uniref:Cytochrome c oxidase assembly factor 6 n=1 Tax=Brachionus calyciflorus TaxID=104777 RepID=A0A813WP53_9BILA|nr:unnamed protein product [Brachionus calyciflorus]
MPVDVTSKEGREQCWLSRDAYWKCLDDSLEDQKKCKAAREQFEKDCSKTWVKHFDRRREYLKFKNVLESGDKEIIDEFLKNRYHK